MKRKSFWFLVSLIIVGLLSGCLLKEDEASNEEPSNGGEVEAYWFPVYLTEAPTIDGRLTEWGAYEPIVTFGPDSRILSGSIDSADDLTLKVWMGWDPDYLYLAIEAIDDSIPTGGGFWDYDDIQLLIDARNDSTFEEYAEIFESGNPITNVNWKDDDYRVIIQPANRVSVQTNSSFVYVNGEAVLVPTDKGYTYEVAIPVSSLPYFWVGDGHVIGLDFKACDADQVVNQDGNTVLTMAHMVSNDDLPVDPWGGADYHYWKLHKCKFEIK